MKVNSMYFDKDARESMYKFIRLLNEMSYDNDALLYNDIHIRPEDLDAFVVEWVQIPWTHDYGGEFKYVDEDQVVTTIVHLPDGTFEYTEDPDRYLAEWLEEHPDYVKDDWGNLVKKDED